MVRSQQLLCYAASELRLHIPNHFPPIFRKGTSPASWEGAIDLHEIKSLLVSTIADLENDYNQGLFKKFNPYATRFGVTLNSIKEAIFSMYCDNSLQRHFSAAAATGLTAIFPAGYGRAVEGAKMNSPIPGDTEMPGEASVGKHGGGVAAN